MLQIPRKSGMDFRVVLIWQYQLTIRIKYFKHNIPRLQHKAVPGAHALVRRFDRELVAAARIPLLIKVEPFEADVELRVRFGFLAAVRRGAMSGRSGKALISDGSRVRAGSAVVIVNLSGKLCQ